MATKLSIAEILMSSKVVICDIEGTTSSISFVKDTLFPYALKNVETFLNANWETDSLKPVIGELREQSVADLEAKLDGAVNILPDGGEKEAIIKSIVQSVEWLMGNDRKVNGLKNLQGLIWENAYKDGSIKGHVYEDVPKAFENWIKAEKKIYIYSSGSVLAQKLLFQYSESGDLLPQITGHFDTKIGMKKEIDSYKKIVEEIGGGVTAENCLFLTDIVKEGDAARSSGLNVILMDRPGNAAFSDEDKSNFIIAKSFEELMVVENGESVSAATGKRKIETDDVNVEEKPTKISKLESDVTEKSTPDVTDSIETEKSVTEDVEMKETPEEEKVVAVEPKEQKAAPEPSVPVAEPVVANEPSKIVEELVVPPKAVEDVKSAIEKKEEKSNDDVKVEDAAMEVDDVESTENVAKPEIESKPSETKADKTEEIVADTKSEKTEEILDKKEEKKVIEEEKVIEEKKVIEEEKVIEKETPKVSVDVEMSQDKTDETDKAADIVTEEKKEDIIEAKEVTPVVVVAEEKKVEKIVEDKVEKEVKLTEKTNGTNGTTEETKESEKTEEIVLENVTEKEKPATVDEKVVETVAPTVPIVEKSKDEDKPAEDANVEIETKEKNGVIEEQKNGNVEKIEKPNETVPATEIESEKSELTATTTTATTTDDKKTVVDDVVSGDGDSAVVEEKEVKNGNGVGKNGHTEKTEEETTVTDTPTAAPEVDDIEKIKKIKESLVATATPAAVVVEAET